MRFVILGTGGIGGYFGARLALAGEDVWFIARGSHLDAMKRRGLQITSTVGTFTVPPGKMTDEVHSIGAADVVLFCVKSYDTESAARQLSPILRDDSLIIPLQNGIDNEEKIRKTITRGDVYGGVAYISSRISAPGEITEVGGFQRIVFGPQERKANAHAQAVHETMLRAGIKSQLQDDITKELWRKLIFIASMGSLTALSRLTHGEILDNQRTVGLMFDAMREVQSVAWKLGVDVEPVDEARVLEGLKRFSDDTRSSMYFDLVAGKPMEIEALNGTIVRLGEQLGVPTPIHRVIYSTLLPHHLKHSKEQASR
ncbi:MAG: 2-dehydropantoate 2-reductase [Ignavibacteriales bacterium]|nr:2-dehydropantoate 2-reductase [Ignavibacteriales bacterium]